MGEPTAAQVKATVAALAAVAEAIRSLKSVPEGHLYAQVMAHVDLPTFNRMVGVMIGAKLVERTPAHVLVWVGPEH